jgi:hypothetical protein
MLVGLLAMTERRMNDGSVKPQLSVTGVEANRVVDVTRRVLVISQEMLNPRQRVDDVGRSRLQRGGALSEWKGVRWFIQMHCQRKRRIVQGNNDGFRGNTDCRAGRRFRPGFRQDGGREVSARNQHLLDSPCIPVLPVIRRGTPFVRTR